VELDAEDARLVDLGVVDLDLVGRPERAPCGEKKDGDARLPA
jgi:hypothetical protein